MLGLAKALAERGHEVLWAAHEKPCAQLRAAGFEAIEAGPPENLSSKTMAERFPWLLDLPPAERPDFMFAKIFGPERAGPMLDDLLPVTGSFEPSLLVCDQAELAGPIAAALAGVPNVTHAFGHPLPEPRVARMGEEMAGLRVAHGLEPGTYAGLYDHLYLDIYPEALKTYDSPHIADVHPIRPAERSGPGEQGSAWPGGDAPLVYVTFGTVFGTTELIRTVVEAIRELPVRVVATCGPGKDPRELGDQPSNVHVADYVPQAELLPHCAAVISHAGSGTFLAALAEGLPQLLLPQAADQFLNARAGARAGAGIEIDPADLSPEAIAAALEALLGDGSYRDAAQRLSADIEAMPDSRAVAAELERRFS